MTREEALRRVKGYLTDYLPIDDGGELDEIMEVLEQEPVLEQENILDKIRNELLSMECMEEAVEVIDKYRLEIPFDGRDEE